MFLQRQPDNRRTRTTRGIVLAAVLASVAVPFLAIPASAHPLGNFTINHFAEVTARPDGFGVRHVLDVAEIPTLQETHGIDSNGDGELSVDELQAYADRSAALIASGLELYVDGNRTPLSVERVRAESHPGAGGLLTLRVETDLSADSIQLRQPSHTVRFVNTVFADRLGWREIVVRPATGVAAFDTASFGNSLSNELRDYPENLLESPLDERSAEFSMTLGTAPAGSSALRSRDGVPVAATRDRLAELIAVPELTPWIMLVGLLVAAGLGALHAMSPGHGKTVVGAYLVGARGTLRHALFLGLTVTITHTAGVFALGIVTLFAANFVSPEQLYPILGVLSGAIVLAMGISLFVARIRAAFGGAAPHSHDHHHHDDGHDHTHDHGHHSHGHVHTHGGSTHSHLPPGADGSPVTMRSLLALGISGGLLPCPSALVVLLSAMALQRVGYGLVLVVAFSAGLAGALTAVGLAFVYAGRLLGRSSTLTRATKYLPIVSAAVIAALGAAISWKALMDAGFASWPAVAALFAHGEDPSLAGLGAVGILGLGLLFGLKHATEADHVVAVSTIVSEHRQVRRAAMVGALWGIGHTASLLAVGVVVLTLRIAISDTVAGSLEFCVALMIIGLGLAAVLRGMRGRSTVHVHRHSHDGGEHAHVHFHEAGDAHDHGSDGHVVARLGIKPLIVGAVHGLAGSAALTLLVLAQIDSVVIGLLYLAVFGLGSIAGMLAMSGLIGLPFALANGVMSRSHHGLQIAAGVFSVLFGCWYAAQSSVEVATVLAGLGRHF